VLKEKEEYCVVFYNVENLFDLLDDPLKNDGEFTPAGIKHWTRKRLDKKLTELYKTLIAAGKGEFPDIIGLAEIENLWVLEHLLKITPMSKVPYGIIHKESPDPRGIDVALLYRKDRVFPKDMNFIPVERDGRGRFQSRDILYFCSEIYKETLHFYVNHWPSRHGGYNKTKEKRNLAAEALKGDIAKIKDDGKGAKILLMGDFNAASNEACFSEILQTVPYNENGSGDRLVNLVDVLKVSAPGTIRYRGKWEVFDHFICSDSFLSEPGLRIDIEKTYICKEKFLLEADRKYLGVKPFRTYLGPSYHGGVSDHLPIVTFIKKQGY
jgi:predicted extracellular nuclease